MLTRAIKIKKYKNLGSILFLRDYKISCAGEHVSGGGNGINGQSPNSLAPS
jgi:hypothetical protein